jgi:peptidoglycan/LPS O-acetylase OafA/YrhL
MMGGNVPVRNIEVDRLRSIGALIVLFGHVLLFYFPTSKYLFKSGIGTTIIDISFVISGYVISSILVESLDHLRGQPPQLINFIKSFYVRRFFRIYPVMWAVFLGTFMIVLLFPQFTLFSTAYRMLETSFLLLTSTYNY